MKRFEALTEPTGETSLCNPSFSSQVHIQTAKTQLVMPSHKMQKEVCTDEWWTSFFTDNLKS